jgi:HPt (histidine-containing phosphotransfer) domain-containing protein
MPLDRDYLFRQTFGDRNLERELLNLFHDQAAHILRLIRELTGEEHRRKADLAHNLKGAALAIGADRVAQAATHYENAVAEASPAAEAAWQELNEAVSEALDFIKALVNL